LIGKDDSVLANEVEAEKLAEQACEKIMNLLLG
jgi:hypothetical protein